jgi:hypothetical protein
MSIRIDTTSRRARSVHPVNRWIEAKQIADLSNCYPDSFTLSNWLILTAK